MITILYDSYTSLTYYFDNHQILKKFLALLKKRGIECEGRFNVSVETFVKKDELEFLAEEIQN